MKLATKNYKNLWEPAREEISPSLVINYPDNFFKKSLDHLCLKVDMCESLSEYVAVFCDGMIELIDLGIKKSDIIKHDLVLTKILRLGEDIVEYGEKNSDLFYLGVFIEVKISSNWFSRIFYQLIKQLLMSIVAKGEALSQNIKLKIEKLVKDQNFSLYKLYFVKSRPGPIQNISKKD